MLYLQSFIEPFGTLWFIYLLPIFFVVTKLTRASAAAGDLARGRGAGDAHVATGWTVIDEFASRFVYFYAGYMFAAYVFALSDRARAQPGAGAGRPCALGARQWRRWSLRASANGRSSRWRSASRARAPSSSSARCWRGCSWLDCPALLRRAFDRDLSGVLPADGGDAHVLLRPASSPISAWSR